MIKHINKPVCEKCIAILNRYPQPHPQVAKWAAEFRLGNPDAHLSCVGRGKVDQEADFAKKVSKAHYGQSPHNYNAAMDWFRLTQAGGAAFDGPWFRDKFAHLPPIFLWGGEFTSFRDLPHIEIRGWQKDVQSGLLRLVEPL